MCITPNVGVDEDLCAKMKSILSQMEYGYQISGWVSKGVRFDYHLYVPEVHSDSGSLYYENEDDAHILKVSYSTPLLFTNSLLPILLALSVIFVVLVIQCHVIIIT